jgi:transposase
VAERNVEAILHWSMWRRWHQAWARYYHYRGREGEMSERETPEREVAQAQASQMNVIDVVWSRLERLLPAQQRVGRPYEHERRLVFDAIVYVKQMECGWRNLPSRFPPWQTVYAQLREWRKAGIWDKIWSELDKPYSTEQLQL